MTYILLAVLCFTIGFIFGIIGQQDAYVNIAKENKKVVLGGEVYKFVKVEDN